MESRSESRSLERSVVNPKVVWDGNKVKMGWHVYVWRLEYNT